MNRSFAEKAGASEAMLCRASWKHRIAHQVMASFLILASMVATGCNAVQLTAEPPPLPPTPMVENDVVRAEYVAMTEDKQGQGVLAVRVTNTSPEKIRIGGSQGSPLPARDHAEAWLAYRGSHNLKRFAKTDLAIELIGGEAKVSLDIPEEGVTELEPGQSQMVLVAFDAGKDAHELSVDLQPVLVDEDEAPTEEGPLPTLYLTVPIRERATIVQHAKDMLNKTKFGVQISSDDFN